MNLDIVGLHVARFDAAVLRNLSTALSRSSFCETAVSSLGSRDSTPKRRLTSSGGTRISAEPETEIEGFGGGVSPLAIWLANNRAWMDH
jgi:hypothetical protein